MKQKKHTHGRGWSRGAASGVLCGAALLVAPLLVAQDDVEEEVFELSPFTVEGSEEVGYRATSTLAGTRIRTELKDVGSAISVYTDEFLKDTGATSSETLLLYTTNTEVGGVQGNYTGAGNGSTLDESGNSRFIQPSNNTRVRGLAAADNTRGYFLTDTPWDSYNVDRVDMQRGPNAILFGLGSPAGIINTTLDRASFEDAGELELGFGSYGSVRVAANANKVLLEDELAVRVAVLNDHEKFRQKPADDKDQRFYIAATYQPRFLKSDSSATVLSANFEHGERDSNRPRSITPIDLVSPFFAPAWTGQGENVYGLGKTTSSALNAFANTGMPALGKGMRRTEWEDDAYPSTVNPYYDPAWGGFPQLFGGPMAVFGDSTSGSNYFLASETTPGHGLGPNGSVDRNIAGLPYVRISGVADYVDFAREAQLPRYDLGLYKSKHMSDPTIFDFHNNLIDGDNKEEWSNWDTYNIALEQSFFDNKLAYELAYNRESYNQGQQSFLNSGKVAINIDVNSHFGDGTPNPNVGRPFVSDSGAFGNSGRDTDREDTRFTAVGEYDFRDLNNDSWITRALGRHTVTGLYSQSSVTSQNRSWMRWGTSDDYGSLVNQSIIDDNWRVISAVSYIGPSVLGANSASGLRLDPLGAVQTPTSGEIHIFDSHWNAPSVDPGAYWLNTRNGADSTQAENPANYVGWRTVPLEVVSADAGFRDELTTDARLVRDRVTSNALVLQSYFWDGAIVGTYGWRQDKARNWSRTTDIVAGRADLSQLWFREEGYVDPDSSLPVSDERDPQEIESNSWSVVAHLNELLPDNALPIQISAFYNKSENFKPSAGRANIYGEALPPPSGETTDYGIVVSSKEGRYSLKVNKYETSVTNDSSDVMDAHFWKIGIVENWGYNFAYKFANNAGQSWEQNFNPLAGQTAEQAAAMEKAATDAWFANLPPENFQQAWNLQFDPTTGSQGLQTFQNPNGLAATQDSVSEGYEIEFIASPTDNLRFSMNASKTEAMRNNVGGIMAEWIEARTEVFNGPAGDIRMWSGGGTPIRDWWKANVLAPYTLLKLQEGAANPELREWRFNAVANYSFTDGFLNGASFGGAYRWQDDVVIGYAPMLMEDGETYTFDLENPYRGPSEDGVDLWVGYGKALNDKVDWRIQLNVRNVLADDELIPVTVQWDGSPGAYRISPDRTWTVTNTFTF